MLPGIDVFDTVVDGVAPKFEIRKITIVQLCFADEFPDPRDEIEVGRILGQKF